MSRIVSRGMLQVKGVTYRIERTEPHCYTVVRLLDDAEVGTFRTIPTLRLGSAKIELSLLRDIVRAALRSARTSAVMHVAPVFQPDDESSPAASPTQGARSPSSVPPPATALA
ncbi:MAG TPA: hypothetical protein VHP33_34330 [Polyangiaceae bacterium]|nr:hypothetical protein [Polyangiaceae bacterium]